MGGGQWAHRRTELFPVIAVKKRQMRNTRQAQDGSLQRTGGCSGIQERGARAEAQLAESCWLLECEASPLWLGYTD